MKGIILAGGLGTRLYPLTRYTSKHLLPINDKPMVYYPLSTLMLAGIREIALVSTARDLPNYERLLGDGSQWGLKVVYIEQSEPRGIADVFLVCEEFIGTSSVSLILGDNVFYGNLRLSEISADFQDGALIFAYSVNNPEIYGVVVFDKDGKIKELIEKPKDFVSKYAIPGFYVYDNNVVEYAKELNPSKRGELEITDLNKIYLDKNKLKLQIMGRGIAWLDTGNIDSLQAANNFISTVEKMQSNKIGCPEEIALRKKYIDVSDFKNLIKNMPSCDYTSYLENLVIDIESGNIEFFENLDKLQP